FQQDWVQVSPPLAEARIFVSGNSLNIRGKSPGGKVGIMVSSELRDLYGQRLGEELEIEEQLERPSMLYFLDRSMRVLPVQNPVFSFFAQSIPAVEVVVYPVRPEQWPDYLEHTTRRDCRFSNDGHSSVLAIEPSTVPKAVHIDLGHFLHQRPGHFVIQVRARNPVCERAITEGRNQVGITPEPEPEFGAWQSCWIQVTNLCPALIQSFETVRGRVVDGRTGQLITNSTVSTFEDHNSREYMLVATETDRAFLSTNELRYCMPRLVVYGFSDRKLYKPGETASIKLWAWERPAPGHLLKSAAGRTLPYKLRGPGWSYSLEGEVSLSADGSADLELKLPKELQLGYHKLMVGLQADQLFDEVPIQIEEFRRPKFEVGLQGPEQSEMGATLTYTVRAQSFSGADLSGALTNISFTRKPTNYRPPGWPKFLFGHRRFWFHHPAVPENSHHVSSELSPDGSKTFDLTLDGLETSRTYVVEAHASVFDIDRQQQAASHRHILHSSSLDLGIKMSRIVYDAQNDISFQFIVTDHHGQPVSGRRVQFKVDDEDFFECVSHSKPSGLALKTERRGYLTIHGRVLDERGLASSTQVIVYRLGGFATFSEKKELSALLDKRTYRVGETARLTLLCPQQGTYFLRVVNGAEVDSAEGFAAAGECVLEFPVTETLRGGGKVHVDLVTPGDKMGPLVYRASQDFQVELSDLELLVELTPSKTVAAPGDEIEASARVTDLDGNPLADTEVALVVVDEAVLFAGNYRIPEPLARLYPSQIDRTQSRHLWEENRMPDLAEIAVLMQRAHDRMLACSMAAPASGEGEKSKSHVRRSFAPLAHFAPCLKTDSQGRVRTDFVLPDSLSRFRLTAVVVTSDRRAGYAEAQIQVTKSVLLETSFPRFLSPGDVSFLPITVRNLTDQQRIVEVGLRGTGVRLLEEAAATVTLEPRGACEVPFRVEVKDVPELVLQSVVRSGREQDAVEQTIPVYRAASTETVAQCGQLVEEACSFGLHWPAGALPGFGGLSVELATTALQGLDSAYRYILNYSYGCVEQLACKLAATVSLNDYLDAYRPQEVPDREARDQMTAEWIEQILSRKRGTNFSYWPGTTTSYEYPNLVAYHALALAHHAGYSTPGLQPKGVQQELQTIKFSSLLPDELKTFFEAYLLWVRTLWGDESARQCSPNMRNAGIEAWTFMMRLSPRWQTDGVRHIQNAVTETATTASLRRETSYLMRYSFGSLQRSNAFALSALLEAAPENPLVSKFMTGLQAHRVQGRWRNTQENLFAILALGSYFKAREAVEPDLKAAAWLGDRQFIGRAFLGRETERFRARLPAEKVSRANSPTVVLQSVGQGRLYHRTELTWAVDCRELKPLARGFSLERTYTFVSG
ncbi:MAG: hypothetical protein KC800_18530, partial [Candidatus Eremiobacteraeota bacterium]|nr:hypothetical protein [Candidatus Eremiobacteraeota bacterium]